MKRFYWSMFMAIGLLGLAMPGFSQAPVFVKLSVTSPASIAGDYEALTAGFGDTLETEVSGPILYATPANGCMPITNDLTGSIALVDRGVCGFAIKAFAAQQAGAVAVVICNNLVDFPYKALRPGVAAGDTVAPKITVPVVMVSYEYCQRIKAELGGGVMGTLSPDRVPLGPGAGCATAPTITPGTHQVDSITSGFGAVTLTSEANENSHAKWFRYVPTATVQATVSSCADLTDTRLAIIGGNDDCTGLFLVALNDDCNADNNVFGSEVTWIAEAGETYFIYWDDRWDFNGFEFTLTEAPLPDVEVVFQVDMSEQTVTDAGVRVIYAPAGTTDINDFTVLELSDDDGDGIYSDTALITTLDSIIYAFVNGIVGPTTIEMVPDDCGVEAIFGLNARTIRIEDATTLDVVCFGACSGCAVTDCANPVTLIDDDASGYAIGANTLGMAAHWAGWPGAATSAVVDTIDGDNLFRIDGSISTQDALLLLGNKTEGHYRLSWLQYLPEGKEGYFNIQHQAPTASAGFWAFDVYYDGGGEGRLVLNDAAGSEIPFTYPEDAFFRVIFYFDLDNDEARMIINENVVAGWTFSDGVTNGGANFDLNQLNSVNFYPANANNLYYIDDVLYQQIPAADTGYYCYLAEEVGVGTHTVPELECFGGGFDLRFSASLGLLGQAAYWVKYTPETDGILKVGSCDGGVDTRLWIFEGECHDFETVGVNDDMCISSGTDDYASYREAIVTAGTTYYIAWDDIWETGGFDFTIELSTEEPVEGDFCESAVAIQPGEQSLTEFTGDAAVAGPLVNTFTSSTTPYSNSQWYSFTPEQDGFITVTSCNGTSSDTYVFIYTGECGTLESLTLEASSDDDCLGAAGPSSIDSLEVTAGTTYYIEWIDRYSEDAFIWELIFSPVVDVDEVTLQQGMKVFPNPADEQLRVQLDLPEALPNVQLHLYNAVGALVLQQSIGTVMNQTIELDVHQLPAGTYVLQLRSGGMLVNHRVIIH